MALWCVNLATGLERKHTFGELARLSRQAAHLFEQAGVQRGDRVLVILPRVPEWWIVMLGLIRLGAIPVTGTLLLTQRDVAYRIQAAKIAAVITCPEGLAKVGEFEGVRLMVGGEVPGWRSFEHGLAQANPMFNPEPTRASDPALVFFTSATTGEPKMVLHTQTSYGLAHRLTGELWLDLGPNDIHWNLSDPGWAKAAWSSFFGPWHMGACVFAVENSGKFNPTSTLRTLATYPITTWCAPPTALRLIVKEDLSRWKFPSLRHCVTAGEPLNPEVFHRWQNATGHTLYEAYGQTETVVLIGNLRCLGHIPKPGSMGKKVPGFDLVLLDEDFQEVPPGTEGDVAIRIQPDRPAGLFQEYWQAPENNEAAFRGDYYFTGDRASCDAEGYYWFVGRRDDVIKSSGYRIGPFEIESALLEHEAVLDVGVVGKEDEIRGQIVKAYVMLRPSVEPTDALRSELQEHSKRLVAAYKYPREIEFVKELPKTISGKTRRVALRSHANEKQP